MPLRKSGMYLFWKGVEIRDRTDTDFPTPAHSFFIRGMGQSEEGSRLVSVDVGGWIKVWDPSLRNPWMRVWRGVGFKDVTSVGVNEAGKRLAVGAGLRVTIYRIASPDRIKVTGELILPLSGRISRLRFDEEDNLFCSDGDKEITVEREDKWTIKD